MERPRLTISLTTRVGGYFFVSVGAPQMATGTTEKKKEAGVGKVSGESFTLNKSTPLNGMMLPARYRWQKMLDPGRIKGRQRKLPDKGSFYCEKHKGAYNHDSIGRGAMK